DVVAGAAVELVRAVMAEQLVVVGSAGLVVAAAVEHLPEDPRDRGPAVVRDLVAAAGGLAPVAGAALDPGLQRRAQADARLAAGLALGGRRARRGQRRVDVDVVVPDRLGAVGAVGHADGDVDVALAAVDRAARGARRRGVRVRGQRRLARDRLVGREAARA